MKVLKLIKWFFITIFSIILFLLIFAFFLPNTYYIERKIVIAKPAITVYNELQFLKKQAPETMRLTALGLWGNKKTTSLSIENKIKNYSIKNVNNNMSKFYKRINFDIEDIEKNKDLKEGLMNVYMTCKSLGTKKTELLWNITIKTIWPKNITLYFYGERVIGLFMKGNLISIKKLMEK